MAAEVPPIFCKVSAKRLKCKAVAAEMWMPPYF